MKAAGVYGLVGGLSFSLVAALVPQPWAFILLFGVTAVQLTAGAIITFRRTGLPFASLAMVIGAVESAVVVVLYATGYTLFTTPRPWAIVFWAGMVATPAVLYVDAFVNEDKWEAWKRHMESCSARDIFAGRHIPDLRA